MSENTATMYVCIVLRDAHKQASPEMLHVPVTEEL